MILKVYTWVSHTVSRDFVFKFCCVGCIPVEGIQKLVAQWSICGENNGNYVEN